MITTRQCILIHTAAKQAGLNDAQYRTLLRNVAGVESSKQLDQAGFEDCMAALEDFGFRDSGCASGDYWRTKVALRGGRVNQRLLHRIAELAAPSPYPLAGLVDRFSRGRTRQVEQLRPAEAHQLIEMLKQANSRPPCAAATTHTEVDDELPF